MRVEVVERFVAPGGRQPLRVINVAKERAGDVIEGAVFSPDWGLYPIRDGILNLLPRGAGSRSPAQLTNFSEVVARTYEWPWRYNALSLLGNDPLPLRREATIFKRMLSEPTGDLWLDLGASTALYARWLAPLLQDHSAEVVALDFSPQMLRTAWRHARDEGHQNISFVIARGERLPFADGTVDGVICGGTLNEFGYELAPVALAELARVLKPGAAGLFLHLVEVGTGGKAWLQRYLAEPLGLAFWDVPETDKMFQHAGFVIEQRERFGMVAFTRVRRA